MHIAVLTFEGFNELDSLIAYGMLSRISLLGNSAWKVSIASPTPRVTSMNNLTIDAHVGLEEASRADAVLIGSGMKAEAAAEDPAILQKLQLNPHRQLIAAQCSGIFLLDKLGLVTEEPIATDLSSKSIVTGKGINVSDEGFVVRGNVATAGGCLASQYLATWIVTRTLGWPAAQEMLHYFAPVGEKDAYVARAHAYLQQGHPRSVVPMRTHSNGAGGA